MNTINKNLALIITLSISLGLYSQNTVFSTIHNIEPVSNHYKELKKIDSKKRTEYAAMDNIVYPTDNYLDFILVYASNEPYYLNSSQVKFITNSVSFPANSSEQTRAELDFLIDLQNKRTKKQEKRVLQLARIGYWPHKNYTNTDDRYENNLKDLFFMAREISGEKYNAKDYPKTANLLKGVMHDTRLVEFVVKFNLLRARPYHLDANIKPLQEIPTPSFASGHTLWAYMQAYTLSELVPDKRSEYVALAYEIGLSREIMGVHFPSDEEVARQMSHRMLLLMWHTDKFQKDYKAAKSEWK
ncbi:phosphatase PAP2 family protein [uncultured Lacinutrix sp.]|uniref:phosphatase PAP2 family protein n=1 Tax=uncultured Lacinutrix sp. TaxID=574032 RepID=UPI00260C6090|nr:phosphatase PAP2 family protein [uncultured Lacinutrix sp.]